MSHSRLGVRYYIGRRGNIASNGVMGLSKSEDLSNDPKYRIFQALSHPTRVRILTLIEQNELSFSALKHELGIESSGQLQHHLLKLSGLVSEEKNGCYGLTDAGRRSLEIYWESERSGRSLQDLCCVPSLREFAGNNLVGRSGTLLRLSAGSLLLVLTAASLATYIFFGQTLLNLQLSGASSIVSLGLEGAIIFGFFGVSFVIAALTGYPGCEITAIPNLFSSKKWYCACLMTPFNLPNGRLLGRRKE
ncbi:MAG: ArsR/SmtB family transcription factor [Nitrososphaerales archaeon]